MAARKQSVTVVREQKISGALLSALGDVRRGVSADELLLAITEQMGGAAALGAKIASEYEAADPGSLVRQRIIELIARLTISNTARGDVGKKPVSEMSDEELNNMAVKMARRVASVSKLDGPEGEDDGVETAEPEA